MAEWKKKIAPRTELCPRDQIVPVNSGFEYEVCLHAQSGDKKAAAWTSALLSWSQMSVSIVHELLSSCPTTGSLRGDTLIVHRCRSCRSCCFWESIAWSLLRLYTRWDWGPLPVTVINEGRCVCDLLPWSGFWAEGSTSDHNSLKTWRVFFKFIFIYYPLQGFCTVGLFCAKMENWL